MDKGRTCFNYNCGGILALFLIISLPLLLYQNSTSDSVWSYPKLNQTFPEDKLAPEIAPTPSTQPAQYHNLAVAPTSTGRENHTLKNSRNDSSSPSQTPNSMNQTLPNSTNTSSLPTSNKLLNGLIPLGFDERSCRSRYESHLYRKPSIHKPSLRLISKLRNYERLHRRCGPKSRHFSHTSDCNYIVWIPVNGLGNRMISLASTFLYALLTNRVLLVEFGSDMSGLFCEPFLNSTWKLPRDFPHRHRVDDLPSYREFSSSITVPPLLYVDLQHRRDEYERFFHCSEGQRILKKAKFLFLKSDQYFAPSLFMVPSFEQEANALFPERDHVFHHLGRYLYIPTNGAWRQITRFYKAHLSKADTKIGIQVRVFADKVTPASTITQQILACGIKNRVLPKDDHDKSNSMSILVTSLNEEYSKNLRSIYKGIQVNQPSHEGVQRFNNNSHYVKALTEMYLLSLCDELMTSGVSTFGYVAQGLGGIKPWIMYKTVGTKFRDPPCERALSNEPCFHFPPKYDCERRVEVEHMSSVFKHMKRCEDIGSGLKMVAED